MDDKSNTIKVIIADTDLKTFEILKSLSDKYNMIFLSSDFAVNFMLEYEKIDLVISSNKISNFNSIIERTTNKKIRLLIFGKDIRYPINSKEVESIIIREQERKIVLSKRDNKSFTRKIKKIWEERKKLFHEKDDNKKDWNNNCASKLPKDEITSNSKVLNDQNSLKRIKDKAGDNLKINHKIPKSGVILDTETPSVEVKTSMKIMKQKVIVLTKAKGGVGSTTIGIFLSSVLKNFSTLLFDLNFCEGRYCQILWMRNHIFSDISLRSHLLNQLTINKFPVLQNMDNKL